MKPLPETASDDDLIVFVDRWASLLERGEYAAAYAFTDHDAYQGWTPDLLQHVVESYGDAPVGQRVTVSGVPSDITQRKEVRCRLKNDQGVVGEVWYDLNIDGLASDLTATFDIIRTPDGLVVRLCEIHVM